MRAYIGQGLRADLAKFEKETEVSRLMESLRQQGVSDEVLALILHLSLLALKTEYHEASSQGPMALL